MHADANKNEAMLDKLLSSDRDSAGLTALMVVALLSEEMPHEEFKSLLREATVNAHHLAEMHGRLSAVRK